MVGLFAGTPRAYALLPSTTTVVSSENPGSVGSSITFTATVSGLGLTPTGTVTFMDGATTLGSAPVNTGVASFSINTLSAGSHSITGVYNGDLLYNPSTSAVLTQNIVANATSTSLTSSTNPSALEQSVIFTATVTSSGGTPTGTVTFMDGSITLGTSALNGSGQATFATSVLTPGNHSITANYSGGGSFSAGSSPVLTQTVNLGTSSTAVVSSANPSNFGQAVTFTATVSGLIIQPTGTVTFMDGPTAIGTGNLNASGQATFTTSALSAGSHSITAVYGGDSFYNSSTSNLLTQIVNQNTSTTAVTSSSNPSAQGTSVTFTATVTGAGAAPTGTVTFKDGATTLGSGTLSGGQATFSTSALSVGVHSITAVYGGDSNYSGSTSPVLTQTVTANASATAITSTPNPSTFGQSVTFTATVSGSGGTPTGTVTFKDGAITLGSATLNGSGQASFSTSTLAAGSHSITASYGGDSNYGSSVSPVLTQTVNQSTSTTSVVSSVNPSAFGVSVTFTATVSGVGGTPTGTVTFKDGATTLGTATLNGSGQAALSTSTLSVGSHSITASYGGDGNFPASASPALTQTVTANSSATALSSSVNPSTFGQSVTFTATVSGSGGTPTGTVTFKDGATTLGSAPLNGSGQAAFSTGTLAAGSHSITASYGGDGNFGGSVSPALTQTVNQGSSTTSVTSSVNPSAFGASVTFTATVSGGGGTPTGTVTFKDGATTLGSATLNGAGQAALSVSSLSVGSHSITASYGGDANFPASTSPVLTQTVTANSSTTALSSSVNPSTFGQSVTFTATVTGSSGTPTGTVTFKDGATTLGSGTLNGSGQATFSTSALAAGSHSITANYGGDSNFSAGTSPVLEQTVTTNSSTTAVSSSVNPSTFGQSVTFTATVSGAGTPTGTVTFKDGTTTLGSAPLNGSGQASFSTGTLAAGSHFITASYGGDSNFGGSVSPSLTQTVNLATSATSVTSSINPSAFGATVTFTATVSGSGGTPTGTVIFKDGATTLGSATLNGSGQAPFSTSALAVGSHSITASYGGDGNFAGSVSPTLTQTVNQTAVGTSLTSSVNPSAFGATVTFTAVVSGSGGTPTGTVTFKDGATTLGSATLNGAGQAALSLSSLALGSHSITANYGGDSNFPASTSPVLTQTVTANSSTTAISSSVNPSMVGQSVTFTATVSGSGGTPTGTVTFKDGATTIGSATLNGGGQAALSISTLAAGSHAITASYGGDSNFGGSVSPTLTQMVNQTTASISLTSSPNPSDSGQLVTFTATIIGSGGTPTGTVTFKDNGIVIGAAPLAGAAATFATASLAPGNHSIVAVYGGDANFAAMTSAVLNQSVNTPADSIKLRQLQIDVTPVAAQVSAQAISGSIESAISDGFSDRCTVLVPTATGMHVTFCPERDDKKVVAKEFSALRQTLPPQDWLLWTDLRATELLTNGTSNSLTGRQVNALVGVTHRFTPDVLLGAFGGYELFGYTFSSLDGRLHGQGWTAGGYFGWRFLPGVRFEAGASYSGVNFDATAGTASGSFPGSRILATAALVGTYQLSKTFEISPSVRIYDLSEQEATYMDSLGTVQAQRTFSTGRASAGAKATYYWQASEAITLAPYFGAYADYYFTNDSVQQSLPAPILNGLSGRVLSGFLLKSAVGGQFSLGGELGGLAGNFTMWTVRASAMVPF